MKRLVAGGLLSLLVMGLASAVEAFYVEGLMSGMSSSTVEKILEKHGYEVIAIEANGDIVARNGQDVSRTITAEFCTDRLIQVRNDYAPTFANFVRLVEQKRQELGAPASVKVVPAKAEPKADADAISFNWLDKETVIEIFYKVSEQSQQVAVSHRLKQSCQ